MAGPGDLDPVVIRERLAVNRRRGVPFDEAWRWATVGLSAEQPRTFPHTGTVLSERGLAEWARPAWHAAYDGSPPRPEHAAASELLAALDAEPGDDLLAAASRPSLPAPQPAPNK